MPRQVMAAVLGAVAIAAGAAGCGGASSSPGGGGGDGRSPAWGTVTGHVTEPGGRPVSGVLITPRSLDDPPPAVPELAVFTNDDGRYEWSLPPGNYELKARVQGYRASSGKVSVASGAQTELSFTLQKEP